MKLTKIVKISRPLSWVVFPFIFIFGLILSNGSFTPLVYLIIFSLSFPFCLFGYGINDVYDYRTDKLNPRKGNLEGAIVYPHETKYIKRIALVGILPLIIATLLTQNFITVAIAILLILLGYCYSAPPLRLKTRPPLDSISNGLIYFLLPFLLGFSLFGNLSTFPTKILWITLCVIATHALSTLQDIDADKKAGIKTFGIRFGYRKTAIFSFLVFLLTLLFNEFSLILKIYLTFCIGSTFILFLLPTKKNSSLIFKLIFYGFLLTGSLFILNEVFF